MTLRCVPRPPLASARRLGLALAGLLCFGVSQAAPDYPITANQRSTAQQVAQTGVPLAELAPDAPDRYTVKPGDTLWDISRLFLRSPWRWPELWGMNLQQVANPHLIYPGQLLVLVRKEGRAYLQIGSVTPGSSGGTVKLSPRARSSAFENEPIAAIPLHLIQPFLNEAVVLDTDELDAAPRIVAGQDGRVLLGKGELAYVRGKLLERRDWRLFRQPRPLRDPDSSELLGYEAAFVGTATYLRRGDVRAIPGEKEGLEVPATFTLSSVRQEAGAGDRLAPTVPVDDRPYAPHPPRQAINGRVISLYGDGLSAGANQIVAINKGKHDGLERGHVLSLLRAGNVVRDNTSADRASLQLPDERQGLLFVFQVFNRVSYALILSASVPIQAGDRFIQP
jgi:nucleoid-associated protein YgaU